MKRPLAGAPLVRALLPTLLLASHAGAAPGYSIQTIALEGAPAPGTGGNDYGAFLAVSLDEAGRVAYGAPLASGFPDSGVWLDAGSGPALRMRNGDPAPAPATGAYLVFGAFAKLDGSGNLATAIVLGTGIEGLFLDSAGADSVLVLEGDAAPTPPGGSLGAALGDVGFFGINAAGDVVFRSSVVGGSHAAGVFQRSSSGSVAMLAGVGDAPAGGGPDSYASFGFPAVNDAGVVTFAAALSGGSASQGLFATSGGPAATLATDLDAAPGSGGGSFADFLYPAINASGQVAFLSNLAGGSAAGGLFLASPAVTAVAVDGQALPGAGTITGIGSVPDVAGDGSVAMSLALGGGPVLAGVYVYEAGGFTPVATDGEVPPGTGGAAFASFGLLDHNDAGQVAFVGVLDDTRTGVFLATPDGVGPPHVPLFPVAVLPLLAVLLAATGSRGLRR